MVTAAIAIVVLVSTLVTGLVGAGGGILFLPLVLVALPITGRHPPETHLITGLSLVQGIVATVTGAVLSGRRGHIDRSRVAVNGVALAVGGIAGALGSALVSGRVLLVIFALVATAGTAVLLLEPRPGERHHALAWVTAALLLGVGAIGGAIGVGGAFLIIPILVYVLGMTLDRATGTAFVLQFFLLAPALAGKAATGQLDAGLALPVAVCAVVGTAAGSALRPRLPGVALRYGLAALVALLAVRVWAQLI